MIVLGVIRHLALVAPDSHEEKELSLFSYCTSVIKECQVKVIDINNELSPSYKGFTAAVAHIAAERAPRGEISGSRPCAVKA
jgi:hypothetical protein